MSGNFAFNDEALLALLFHSENCVYYIGMTEVRLATDMYTSVAYRS